MLKDKLQYILKSNNFSQINLANHLDVSRQQVNNKFSKNAFTLNDIISICNLTNSKLIIKTSNNEIIEINQEDIKRD